MNWKLLSTAPNQITAESWSELLKVNGFNSKIIDSTNYVYIGISNSPVRLFVSENDYLPAKKLLSEMLLDFKSTSD